MHAVYKKVRHVADCLWGGLARQSFLRRHIAYCVFMSSIHLNSNYRFRSFPHTFSRFLFTCPLLYSFTNLFDVVMSSSCNLGLNNRRTSPRGGATVLYGASKEFFFERSSVLFACLHLSTFLFQIEL